MAGEGWLLAAGAILLLTQLGGGGKERRTKPAVQPRKASTVDDLVALADMPQATTKIAPRTEVGSPGQTNSLTSEFMAAVGGQSRPTADIGSSPPASVTHDEDIGVAPDPSVAATEYGLESADIRTEVSLRKTVGGGFSLVGLAPDASPTTPILVAGGSDLETGPFSTTPAVLERYLRETGQL